MNKSIAAVFSDLQFNQRANSFPDTRSHQKFLSLRAQSNDAYQRKSEPIPIHNLTKFDEDLYDHVLYYEYSRLRMLSMVTKVLSIKDNQLIGYLDSENDNNAGEEPGWDNYVDFDSETDKEESEDEFIQEDDKYQFDLEE
jgi:hypothetical protein